MSTVRNEFSILASDLAHKRFSFDFNKQEDLDLIISLTNISDRIHVDELKIDTKLCHRLKEIKFPYLKLRLYSNEVFMNNNTQDVPINIQGQLPLVIPHLLMRTFNSKTVITIVGDDGVKPKVKCLETNCIMLLS